VTFRARLTLVAAVAVAVAILLASSVIYLIVRGQLRGQVDRVALQLQGALQRLPQGRLIVNDEDAGCCVQLGFQFAGSKLRRA